MRKRKWSTYDEVLLLELFNQASLAKIAQMLDRTEEEVREKIKEMGLHRRQVDSIYLG